MPSAVKISTKHSEEPKCGMQIMCGGVMDVTEETEPCVRKLTRFTRNLTNVWDLRAAATELRETVTKDFEESSASDAQGPRL